METEKRKIKTTDKKILEELKALNKNLDRIFMCLDDTRKITDNMWNDRRPF